MSDGVVAADALPDLGLIRSRRKVFDGLVAALDAIELAAVNGPPLLDDPDQSLSDDRNRSSLDDPDPPLLDDPDRPR